MRVIGDVGEFGLIQRVARAAGRGASRGRAVVVGIGDDAAVLRLGAGEELVVSTDACVEDVHFRWRTQSPRTVGRRAMVAALSDLAAMGARPLGVVWAFAAPPSLALARFDAVTAGLLQEARAHGCPLVGGNLTRARQTSLTLTVLGATRRGGALRRAARAGDTVCVTGSLGRAALENTRAALGRGRVRHVPTPRLRAGRVLARIPDVRGCVDVSDGLEADLAHLVGPAHHVVLEPSRVPRPPRFAAACARIGVDPDVLALCGGEDYELLFAVRPGGPGAAGLTRRLGVAVSELGRVARGPAEREPGGWRHL